MCWLCNRKKKVDQMSRAAPPSPPNKIEMAEGSPKPKGFDKTPKMKIILKDSDASGRFAHQRIVVEEHHHTEPVHNSTSKAGTAAKTNYLPKEPENTSFSPVEQLQKISNSSQNGDKSEDKLHYTAKTHDGKTLPVIKSNFHLEEEKQIEEISKEFFSGLEKRHIEPSNSLKVSPISKNAEPRFTLGKDGSDAKEKYHKVSLSNDSSKMKEFEEHSKGSIDESDLGVDEIPPKRPPPIIVSPHSQLPTLPRKQPFMKQLTQGTKPRNRGYRTLKYTNILDMKDTQSKNEDTKNHLSTFFNQTGMNQGNVSVLVCDQDDIHKLDKKDLSYMDLSINPLNVSGRRSHRSQTKVFQRSPRNRAASSSLIPRPGGIREPEEIRENKDLNTTYIRTTEILGPKMMPKDLGIKLVGKRTKINQYVIIKSLGKGSWGEVFLVIHTENKNKYVKTQLLGDEGAA